MIAGDGDLGHLQRQAEVGVLVHDRAQLLRVIEAARLDRFLFLLVEHVILQADRVDGRALAQRALDEHIVLAAVVAEGIPDFLRRLVDDQLVVREVPAGGLEAPLNDLWIMEKLGLVPGAEHLVDDLPAVDAVCAVLGKLAHALLQVVPDLARAGRQPVGRPAVVVQAVRLGRNAVLIAEVQAQVDRRPAVNRLAVGGEAQPALLGLQTVPVEGEGRHVEQMTEGALIVALPLLVGQLTQQEQVSAEEKVVRFLLQGNARAGNGLPLRVDHAERVKALAVLLDAGLNAHVQVILLFLEGTKRCEA